MSTRFPSEAANADFLGEDPDEKRVTSEPPLLGADGTPRGRADGTPETPQAADEDAPSERRGGRPDDKLGGNKSPK